MEAQKPNTAKYNLTNDSGRTTYNRDIETYYKSVKEKNHVPLIDTSIYKGCVKKRAYNF